MAINIVKRLPNEEARQPPPLAWLWLARGLALIGAGLAGYLLWVTIEIGRKPVGCGDDPGLDCENVLASRWSHWLGVPVSLPALVLYAIVFLALLAVGPRTSPVTRRDAWRGLLPLGAFLTGAAIWFIALQSLVLRSFCPYCLAAHLCGLLIAGFIFRYSPVRWRGPRPHQSLDIPAQVAWGLVLLGLAGPAVLLGGQLFGKVEQGGVRLAKNSSLKQPSPADDSFMGKSATRPESHVTYKPPVPSLGTDSPVPPEPTPPKAEGSASEPAKSAAPIPPGRRPLPFDNHVELDPFDHPCLGSPLAPHVVAELFDYTCPHCRELYPLLEQARQRYGDQLTILLLPMPLDSRCNKHINFSKDIHKNACAFARLILAVWKTKPAEVATMHRWLFSQDKEPTAEAARAYAAELVGADALEQALQDPDLGRRINENGRIYTLAERQLPKLITKSNTAIIAFPAKAQDLFDFFEKYLRLKPATR